MRVSDKEKLDSKKIEFDIMEKVASLRVRKFLKDRPQVSPAFSSGMIDGYFDDKVSDLFWKLLAVYILSNLIGALPWAIPYGEEEVAVMQNQAKKILEWYHYMNRIIPSWYLNKNNAE
nr:hypothetical protein [Streptococcus oralis]